MSDLTLRLIVITAVVAITLLVVWGLGRRRTAAPRRIPETGLGPGVYLFTSATCPDCAPARKAMITVLGEGGFVEISWSESPETFERLEIAEVPAAMVVGDDGSARCWVGHPARMLATLGP